MLNCLSRYMLLHVRLYATRAHHTKTVEVRIMKFLPHDSPMPLVFVR